MIFVTMDETDLLSRTNYTVRYEMDDECDDSSDDESYDLRFLESDSSDPTDNSPASFFPGHPRNPSALQREAASGAAPSASPLWTNYEDQINQSRPPPAELLQPHATFSHKAKGPDCPNYVIHFNPAMYVNRLPPTSLPPSLLPPLSLSPSGFIARDARVR